MYITIYTIHIPHNNITIYVEVHAFDSLTYSLLSLSFNFIRSLRGNIHVINIAYNQFSLSLSLSSSILFRSNKKKKEILIMKIKRPISRAVLCVSSSLYDTCAGSVRHVPHREPVICNY